jgi:carbon storage regulator
MLILSRRKGESIFIGEDIEITVVGFKGGQALIGIKAPRSLVVDREEVAKRKAKEGSIRELMHDELHVDPMVALPAGEVRTLRAGVDYDPDAVCPGCGCFRDRCACDLREAAAAGVSKTSIPDPEKKLRQFHK